MPVTTEQFKTQLPDPPPLPPEVEVEEWLGNLLMFTYAIAQKSSYQRERKAYQMTLSWPFIALRLYANLLGHWRLKYSIGGNVVENYQYPALDLGAGGGNLVDGQTVTASIKADDPIHLDNANHYHDYFFTANLLDTIHVAIASSAALQLQYFLYDPGMWDESLEEWEEDDWTDDGSFPLTKTINEYTGLYKLRVYGFNQTTGSYTLTFSQSPVPTWDGSDYYGTIDEHSLEGYYGGWWQVFRLAPGVQRVNMISNRNFYPSIQFKDDDGNVDESFGNDNYLVVADVPTGATLVYVGVEYENFGSFALKAEGEYGPGIYTRAIAPESPRDSGAYDERYWDAIQISGTSQAALTFGAFASVKVLVDDVELTYNAQIGMTVNFSVSGAQFIWVGSSNPMSYTLTLS